MRRAARKAVKPCPNGQGCICGRKDDAYYRELKDPPPVRAAYVDLTARNRDAPYHSVV